MVGEPLPCRPRPPHGSGRVRGELVSGSAKKIGPPSGGGLWPALHSFGQHAGRRAQRVAAHCTTDARTRRHGVVVRGGDAVPGREAETPKLWGDALGERKKIYRDRNGMEERCVLGERRLVECGVSQDKGGLQVEGEKTQGLVCKIVSTN